MVYTFNHGGKPFESKADADKRFTDALYDALNVPDSTDALAHERALDAAVRQHGFRDMDEFMAYEDDVIDDARRRGFRVDA